MKTKPKLYDIKVYQMLDPAKGFTEPVSVVRHADAFKIKQALDAVIACMDGKEWSADTGAAIAFELEKFGIELDDYE